MGSNVVFILGIAHSEALWASGWGPAGRFCIPCPDRVSMRLLTNVGLSPHWRASSGEQGQATIVHTLREVLANLRGCDGILIDSNPRLLMELAALFLACPWLRRPLIGSDPVLRMPESRRERLTNPAHRLLLSMVDHFLMPFHDLRGCQRYFGIRPEKTSFYRFKPNLRGHCSVAPNPDGEYVLALGRSMRDFDGFFDAMAMTGLPGAIADPDLPRLRANGSLFTRHLDQLPANVRVLPHNPDDYQSQVDILMGARLVVVALRKSCLVATGTPYNAMLLGKCVLVTEGPATVGLFDGEVLTIPAEDAAGMAKVIERAWHDRGLRESTAARGRELALTLGGTHELKQRLLDLSVAWIGGGDDR